MGYLLGLCKVFLFSPILVVLSANISPLDYQGFISKNINDEEKYSLSLDERDLLLKDLLNPTNGTDSGMYNQELYQGDILLQDSKSAISNPNKLWPSGVVIFKIADDVGCPDSRQCRIIMHAMETYHKKTCIRFKEWTGEEDFVDIFYNNKDSGACWSVVGKSGGWQRLSLGYRCWYLGIAVHELGHALGFWHEMNRPDRDNHIIIHWNNILPGFITAFSKNHKSSVNDLGEHFDTESIMMYDEYAFSKDGKSSTIETRSGKVIGPIWKKQGLSESDVRRVDKLYQCNGSNTKKGFPYELHCNFNSHTCGFRNRGRVIWKWREFNKSGYIFSVGNDTISQAELVSANFHSPDKSAWMENFGCLTITFYLSGESTLQVKQEILYSPTDISRGFSKKLWSSNSTLGKWTTAKVILSLKKPFRVVFISNFKSSGVVAVNSVNITLAECFP